MHTWRWRWIIRSGSTGWSRPSRVLVACVAPGVCVAAVAVAHGVGELDFRGHRWRGAVVCDRTLGRSPEEPVSDVGR
jgi:hypothetical protein